MDELLEQIMSASSCGDGAGSNTNPWNSSFVGSANSTIVGSTGMLQGLPRLSQVVPSVGMEQGFGTDGRCAPQNDTGGVVQGSADYSSNDTVFPPQFEESELRNAMLTLLSPLDASQAPGGLMPKFSLQQLDTPRALASITSEGMATDSATHTCPSLLRNNLQSYGSGLTDSHRSLLAFTRHQHDIAGAPTFTSEVEQGKLDASVLFGKTILDGAPLETKLWDSDGSSKENRPANVLGYFMEPPGLQSEESSGIQALVCQSDITSVTINRAERPRLRARRGQATDQHSISERKRRVRIADRMKTLQKLVPDSNKTDKASMLDEIIHYVKLLQMNLKVAGGNFLAALGHSGDPYQEALADAERHATRLMNGGDINAATQFLQSQGLCLMPISLATTIPSGAVAREHLGRVNRRAIGRGG